MRVGAIGAPLTQGRHVAHSIGRNRPIPVGTPGAEVSAGDGGDTRGTRSDRGRHRHRAEGAREGGPEDGPRRRLDVRLGGGARDRGEGPAGPRARRLPDAADGRRRAVRGAARVARRPLPEDPLRLGDAAGAGRAERRGDRPSGRVREEAVPPRRPDAPRRRGARGRLSDRAYFFFAHSKKRSATAATSLSPRPLSTASAKSRRTASLIGTFAPSSAAASCASRWSFSASATANRGA